MILTLSDPAAADVRLTGAKASRLAALRARGFRVPDGVVVTTEAFAALTACLDAQASPEVVSATPLPGEAERALRRHLAPGGVLHGVRVAVRSSAVAEDMAGASFAGQYETFLDLSDEDAIVQSVQQCFASAFAARVDAYKSSKAAVATMPSGMAVLIQHFVEAEAAGVGFTAHPVTGEREVVVVSAVHGVGESLVSGHSSAEEWEVRGARAQRRRSVTAVLNDADALAVAALARHVEAGAGAPQDIEWAKAGGEVFLLQARPMTALPTPVRWDAPLPGGWVRNFRLGEWLGDPVTPLFESWCLSRIERRFSENIEDVFGLRVPEPQHVVVNGWYFYGLPDVGAAAMLKRLPVVLWRVATHFRQAMALVPPTARFGYESEYRRWATQLMPAYEKAVAEADAVVETADAGTLMEIINQLTDHVGDQFTSIVGVAGFAAKAEMPLFQFWKANLASVDGSCLHLVRGIEEVEAAPHAVQGLDWFLPTLGETSSVESTPDAAVRSRIADERRKVEAAARSALMPRPGALAQFDRLLATARAAHVVRQRQTGRFTLAWPVMRRALTRLGHILVRQGALTAGHDVFFLQHHELLAVIAGSAAPDVAERRATWMRQRKLTPPLLLGQLSGMWKEGFAQLDALLHGSTESAPNEMRGNPGSPGRVTGKVRVLLHLEEIDRLQAGEILVAPVTTPGWTPAFARAAAIVTDTGSVASHASIVAREYGIPAVVATGNATSRLCDGQTITVDGSRGIVLLSA